MTLAALPDVAAVEALLRPKSIAVVGASERGPGATLSRNLATLFAGETHYVNPNRPEVFGNRTVPTTAELPPGVDLAAVAVGQDRILDATEAVGRAGIHHMVVVTPGFGETGEPEGIERERRLLQLCGQYEISMCGPNCLGIMNFADRIFPVTHDMTKIVSEIAAGQVAIVSQSGGLLISMFAGLMYRNVGLSRVVSSGSELNVGAADYLGWLATDPSTRAIGVVVEGLSDGAQFLRAATECVAAGKPVVVLKLGRSARAAASVQAHTGKLAGNLAVFRAACRQYGIGFVEDLDEFNETMVAFSPDRPAPRGNRLAAAMISGGAATLVVDACADGAGPELARLSPTTLSRLTDALPDYATVSNPLDITGGSTTGNPELVTGALQLLADDPNVDLTAYICPVKPEGGPVAPLIEKVMQFAGAAEPPVCLVSLNGAALGHYWREVIPRYDAIVLEGFAPAMRALGHLGAVRARVDTATRRLASDRLPVRNGPASAPVHALPYRQARDLLSAHGFRFAPQRVLAAADDVRTAAHELAFPVALKAFTALAPHKTEAGAVLLGLADEAALRGAYDQLRARASEQGWSDAEFVVEQMVPIAAELLLGVSWDPTFGHVLVAGAGGVLAELLPESVSLRLTPLADGDATAMLSANPLLQTIVGGYRGNRAADPIAVATLLEGLNALVEEHPEIRSIDVNPVVVNAADAALLALDALIEVRTEDC